MWIALVLVFAAWAVTSAVLVALLRQARKIAREALGHIDTANINAAGVANEALDANMRAQRYFEVIERIEKQRNQWQDLYHQAVAGASAAQSWLFRECNRLARHAGRPVDPKLKPFLDDYKRQHDPTTGLGAAVPPLPPRPDPPGASGRPGA